MVLMISLVACILTYFIVIPSSNFLVLFVLMLEFGLSMIMFAFILTAMFSKAKVQGDTQSERMKNMYIDRVKVRVLGWAFESSGHF